MKDSLIEFVPLFAGLDEAERSQLAAGFVEGQCSAKSALFKTRDRADALYLLEQGFVTLTTDGGHALATLGPGSILGEANLFRHQPHDIGATAASDLTFWKLSDSKLREIVLAAPSVGIKLSRNFGSLLAQMEDYLVQQLGRTAEFSGLPPHTLKAAAAHLEVQELASGRYLFQPGESPKGIFLVERGTVELRPEDGVDRDVQTVGPGQLIGGLPLLSQKLYTHQAMALQDTIVWKLSAEDFQNISASHPGLRRSLSRNARGRLGRSDQAQAVLRLAQMPLFSEVPPQVMQAIAQRVALQHAPAGDRIYTVGEAGDALYLVEKGEVELTAENAAGVMEELARVADSGFFGEMSLLTGQVRTEDATAIRNTNIWALYKSDLDDLSAQYPSIGRALSQGLATRLSVEQEDPSEERFRQFELFADLSPADMHHVVERLQPTRYRAGEQIFRAASPADMLFLIEKGQVRIQPFSGGSWLLGPGETFGERALLTSQPHNTSALAETDVDVWMLRKADFDQLMSSMPTLALSLSRMLSKRLASANYAQAGAAAPATEPDYSPTVPMATPAVRRREAVPADSEDADVKRMGFRQWFTSLSPMGKLLVAALILLLIWLIVFAAPATLLNLIQGTSVAGSAPLSSADNALEAVYALGSYELSQNDQDSAKLVAMVDSAVEPTPTYTPPPTNTPIPTSTPLPTNTPTITPRPTNTSVPQPVVEQLAPLPTDTPTPEPVVQAAAAPARAWDPRLDRLGVNVEEAQVPSGQPYWRLIEARWQDEQEAGGKHHIFVEVLDETGNRIVGQPVTVFWGDGSYTGGTEDKKPPDYAWNYQMYAAGNAYNIKVDGLPSDVLRGAGMGDLERPRYGIHTVFLLTYQRTTKP